ncbi:MAG: His-Xaa-Ser system radical SAM maturase HxsC [Lentisphaeria bacterium]|nr:His-Xaa-Ser system radical SAM maturase HxsC [Lentisphaeria bacterium]
MNGRFRWDIHSNDNTLFVTSRCNNRCLMCAQPPLERNDIEFHFRQNIELLEEAPPELPVIGISGGEPTLAGDLLFELLERIHRKLPETAVQLLSNGRAFADPGYARKLTGLELGRLLIGIPLHSDFHGDHDAVTQVKGSWSETMRGLYRLACFDVEIELRIVIQKMNCRRLLKMAEFICRNLPFVSSVIFMGLEFTGFAVRYEAEVWVDPVEYRDELEKAVKLLDDCEMPVAVFNLPHCVLTPNLRVHACRSISDWKVFYPGSCAGCACRNECGGLFSTSGKQSRALFPIQADN